MHASAELVGRPSVGGVNIFITSTAPWPVSSGVQTKLASLLLSSPATVHVISPEEFISPSAAPTIMHVVPHKRGGARNISLVRGLLPSQARVDAPRVIRQVVDIVRVERGPVYVHLDTIAVAHLAPQIRSAVSDMGRHIVIVTSLNDSYSFLRAEAGGGRSPSVIQSLIERNEARWLPHADFVDVVSAADVGWIARIAPRARVRVLPLGVLDEWTATSEPTEERDLLMFSGGPGIDEFLREGLPRLRSLRPSLSAAIVGPRPSRTVEGELLRSGVPYLGYVPNIADEATVSRVLLAPSQQRCGMSNRAMLGFVNGTCVVGGQCLHGFQGAIPGREYLSAPSAGLLADQVALALSNDPLRARIGAAGRSYAESLPRAADVGQLYWKLAVDA